MRSLRGPRGSGSRRDALRTEEAAEYRESDEDLDISPASRTAKKLGAGRKKKEGPPKKGAGGETGDGQTLNGFNRETGVHNRRYRRDGEYCLPPRCPRRDAPRGDEVLFPKNAKGPRDLPILRFR